MQKNAIWIYMTATLPYLFLHLHPENIQIPYLLNPHNRNWHHHSAKSLVQYKEWSDDRAFCYYDNDTRKKMFFPNNRLHFSNIFCSYKERENRFTGSSGNCIYYYLPTDFSYINSIYFDKWDEIVSAIKASPKEEKWLIFVSSKQQGELIKQQLLPSEPTVFITANSKDCQGTYEQQTFQHIVEQEHFEQRVLIATKVLDNGINLKDSALKHMVIDAYEETTFLQMLGRRRRQNKNDRLHLYLRNVPEGTLRKIFRNHILEIILFWSKLLQLQQSEHIQWEIDRKEKFLSEYTSGGQYKRLFQAYLQIRTGSETNRYESFYAGRENLLIDMYEPASYATYKLTYEYYKMLAMFERAQNERIDQLKVDHAITCAEWIQAEKPLQKQQFMWLEEQLSWLGLNDANHSPHLPSNWITAQTNQTEECKTALLSFLSEHGNESTLTLEEEVILKTYFCTWIQSVRPIHKDAKSKGSISIINRCFQEFEIGYYVESVQKTVMGKQRNWWVVKRAAPIS